MKEKVLVIQTAFPGDAVLTLPLIQELSKTESFYIDVVCIPSTKEIFEASEFINEILVLDKHGKHSSIFKLRKFGKELKENTYQKIITPHRSLRTALLVMFSGVRDTTGFSNSAFPYVYKNIVEYHLDHHEVQRNLLLISERYISNWKLKPELKFKDAQVSKVNSFLENEVSDKRIAAIAPASIWNTKKYPLEYFEIIIKELIDLEYKVVLIGGEKDVDYIQPLLKLPGVFTSAGKLSLVESAYLLTKCDFLISNDSAPTHLGVAAGIKVLTIYCSTVPEFGFYPYNEGSSFVSFDDLSCKPCGIHGWEECPIKTFECGKKLIPEIIVKMIEEVRGSNVEN